MTDEDKADDALPVSKANLDDAFDESDEGNDEVGAEPAKKPEPEKDEKGEKPSKDEEDPDEEAEPPAAEEQHEGKSVPVAALKSERQKRQAAEAKLNELEKKLNPEKEKTEGELVTEHERFAHRTDISRELMMEEHDDYEAMESIFTEIAKADPDLVAKMMAHKNPAKFAYETAIKSPKGQEYKEFQEFRKAKAKGKPVEETPEAKRNKSALSVPNLNKAPSVSSNSTPQESLETLDEMFED